MENTKKNACTDCVSSHEALLKTSQEMLGWLEEYEHYISDSDKPNYKKWRQVIAKATS